MKSFKQMMAEVAEPKSPEEKRFKDQHAIQKIDHPAAEDSQFTGEITGKTKQKRLADQEGDADYDQAYSQRKDGKAKLESVEEDGEQIDEISKKLAGRYIKKAQMDTAHAGDQIATGSMGQAGASPDVKKGYEKQRKKGIAKLIRRRVGTRDAVAKLTGTARVAAREEVELSENPMEEKPMMMNALRTMSHNMQGIAAYVSKTPDPEEWFQNKLAGVAKEMQTLYGYATAETMAMGEAKTDEELKGDQHKLDHNKNGKIDAHDFKMLRKKKNEEVEQLDELSPKTLDNYKTKASMGDKSDSALRKKARAHKTLGNDAEAKRLKDKAKKRSDSFTKAAARSLAQTTGYTGEKGSKLNKAANKMPKSYRKEEVESVEMIEEAVKQGNMKLRDGSSVKVSKQDAGLINQMMKDLNPANRRKMEKVMMTDKAGFEEIVGFAREAL